jgi:hypothetical protein
LSPFFIRQRRLLIIIWRVTIKMLEFLTDDYSKPKIPVHVGTNKSCVDIHDYSHYLDQIFAGVKTWLTFFCRFISSTVITFDMSQLHVWYLDCFSKIVTRLHITYGPE